MRRLLACLLVAAALPAAASAGSDARSVTVEGPAALAESGFVRAVLVPVARRKGIAVRYVSTDGAAALRDVRAGKAQVALSDNTAAEAAFIASSRSLEPTGRLVLYGDDVLIGPTRDPAAVAAQAPTDVAAALRLVAANGTAGRSDFIAGGIGQGESPLWRAAKVTHGEQAVPVGERWYHYGASDPAAVVRSAAGCRYASHACYALVDRAVFRRLQATGHARGLRIVVARNAGGAAGSKRGARTPGACVRNEGRWDSRALAAHAAHLAWPAGGDRQVPGPRQVGLPRRRDPARTARAGHSRSQGPPDRGHTRAEMASLACACASLVERAGHPPVVLATTRTDSDGAFAVSVRVDANRKLHGTLVLHSDRVPGQSAGAFTIGRMG